MATLISILSFFAKANFFVKKSIFFVIFGFFGLILCIFLCLTGSLLNFCLIMQTNNLEEVENYSVNKHKPNFLIRCDHYYRATIIFWLYWSFFLCDFYFRATFIWGRLLNEYLRYLTALDTRHLKALFSKFPGHSWCINSIVYPKRSLILHIVNALQ